MDVYTHQGFCGRVPRDYQEGVFDRHEQQLAWEDKFYGSERCDFGEADEAAARLTVRYARDREVNLGGILAQADRLGDGGRT